ncbi:MAG: hypothetical protein DRH12_09550, partial [Deltaproteobacteria bacterium]
EKQRSLGGQLLLGSITGYKKELLSLIEFQKRQIKKFGVKLHLGQEVTAETVEKEKPDVVILATGSSPAVPPVEGIDKPIVALYPEALNGDDFNQLKVVIVGGGATGSEVALHLTDLGCTVTIVEMLPKVGQQLESMTRKVLLQRLNSRGVEILTETSLRRVEDKGVVVADKEGNERFIEADRVIVAIGTKPDNTLYDQIKSKGYEIYRIGDCLEPRNAKAAIYEGAVLGRSI